MRSPTARTLQYLRNNGWRAVVVERFNTYSKRYNDVFGYDILAIRNGSLLGIQTTSGTNHASRVEKSLGNQDVAIWLGTGAQFQVWSWSEKGPRGMAKTWMKRITCIELDGNGSLKAREENLWLAGLFPGQCQDGGVNER